jgi:hypothetical protein
LPREAAPSKLQRQSCGNRASWTWAVRLARPNAGAPEPRCRARYRAWASLPRMPADTVPALEPSEPLVPTAAVAVILAGAMADVALIRRSERPDDPWSGHMALPGGRKDPVDADLWASAERETREKWASTCRWQRSSAASHMPHLLLLDRVA